jgi:type IV secretory pathway VirB3-like protein
VLIWSNSPVYAALVVAFGYSISRLIVRHDVNAFRLLFLWGRTKARQPQPGVLGRKQLFAAAAFRPAPQGLWPSWLGCSPQANRGAAKSGAARG